MTDASPSAPPSRFRQFLNYPLVAMVIAIALIILTLVVVQGGVEAIADGMSERGAAALALSLGVLLLVAVTKTAIAKLGETKRDDLRLPGAVRDTLNGLGLGFVTFSAIVGLAGLVGVYRIAGWGDTKDFLFPILAIGIFPGVFEEILFRGVIFRWLEEWAGSIFALLASSALFGVAHLGNPNATAMSAIGIALEAGVLLGAAYMLTRSLWFPIALHASWNITQGEIWDISVSGTGADGLVDARMAGDPLLTGGAFGLEASILAILVATAVGLWVLRKAYLRHGFVKPRWVRRRLAAQAALGSAAVDRTA